MCGTVQNKHYNCSVPELIYCRNTTIYVKKFINVLTPPGGQLDKRARNLSLTMQKTDTDYHDACLKAESERQEWESTVYKVQMARGGS